MVGSSLHRQHPPVGLRDAAQFYRVLLGHHDRQDVAEVEVFRAQRVMVRKRVQARFGAIGTREYYKKLGYSLEGTYMVKAL